MATELNWKPVLRGRIYCSSACGASCTKEAFDLATKNAAELAERLGEGWKPRVWENMGWYYSAFKGVVQVHPPGPQATLDPTYICFCNTTPQFTSRDPYPIQAVELAIKDLDSFIAHIQTQRANLNGVIKRA